LTLGNAGSAGSQFSGHLPQICILPNERWLLVAVKALVGSIMRLSFRSLPWLTSLLILTCSARAQVVISEFMADNKHTLADEDNQFSDWIELYNSGAATVNLAGWALTDDPTHQAKWVLPSTNLTAKGFLVVFASGKNRGIPGAPLHTDFSLKASGEYLALLKPDSSVVTEFAPEFPPQFADISYGLAQNVTTNTWLGAGAAGRFLIPANSTLGSTWIQSGFNDSAWPSCSTGIGYQTSVPGFAVHNYIAAISTCALSDAQGVISSPAQQLADFAENAPVINYLNTGDPAHYGNDQTFPGLSIGTDRDNFVTHATATITIPAPGNWTFGVNSDDGFSLAIGAFTMAYPNPRGPGDTLQTFNFPAAGDYPLDLVFYECGGGSEVELFAAQGSFGAWNSSDFHLVGDVADGGLAVSSPIIADGGGSGSYRPLIATDLQTQMQGINSSAFLRVPFNVPTPAALQSLTLRMKYDDGFLAYLNGQLVAGRNAPAAPQWDSGATASHPNQQALVFEDINISDQLGALRPGNNILAIQGLNQTAADADFLILPSLVEYQTSALTNEYFAAPSPGSLNSSGFVAFVSDTKFSVDRGFFTVPFTLSITSATPQATIIYTTDGSTPSAANGFTYTAPLYITKTTVIRAAAFKPGFQPSNVDTESYLFPSDVVRQSPNGETPPGWPSSWGANVVDYGMDPDVVNNPAYSSELTNDLKSIPSYCITTDPGNLFDPATGIYANPGSDGIGWERPASIELIYPDGTKGFHVNAGIRIRGGYSRSTGNPKHAFRFFFRQQYGTSKLNFPAFANQGGADSFDGFDLRTFENYSWSFEGDYRFIALRDQWSRDTQLAMGQPGERGDMYHLYINGEYWGLYNTDERPEASYGATYFGGSKEDYDTVKVDTSAGYTIFATDGNMDAWTRLWEAATNGFTADANYFKIQGLNVDGTRNPAYENLLDVDNLIDYMLVIFFTGNLDAPISEFIGDTNPNNEYALRNRTGLYGGFRFIAHDSEHTLLHESPFGNDEIHRNRTGPFAAGNPLDPSQGSPDGALARSNPQYIFTRLTTNPEFRVRLTDHIQRHFFNGGALTSEACRARFLTRSNEIYGAIACESARWGDSKQSVPRTRNVDWVTEMNRVYGDYFGQRPGIVLGQLQAQGWFPAFGAPSLNQFGGNVTNGFAVVMSATTGIIYYTLDGSDPRLRGGAISPAATKYTGPLVLNQSIHLKARVLSGSTWSGLTEATFYVIQNFTDLLLTEIMYHPPGEGTNFTSDDFEFIELKSVASTNLELSGLYFTNGITYTFPVGTFLAPGHFIVLASNPAAFTNRYPAIRVDGVFSGKLSNSGETLKLVHASGSTIFSVNYATTAPWPSAPDGSGFSLVPVNPNANPNPSDPANWRSSAVVGGSPGADDPPRNIARILVNEVLTHTDLPQLDSVELYNPYSTNVDISNWYLTDQRTQPQKFRIPSPTVIPANGYKVLTENDWNADPLSTNSFRLDSHGEEIYLYSGDTNGTLTGYSDGFAFGAAQNGVSFGRYVTSTSEAQYPAQLLNTFGQPNSGPRVGPLVINEIHYHPLVAADEFIELKSLTNGSLALYNINYPSNTWRLNGVGFDFPTNTQVAPNGLVLLVAGDPAAFRTKFAVPATVPIFGPYSGHLQGGGETVSLQRPDDSDLNTNNGTLFVPYIDVDVVRYNDKAPWPTNADGWGSSLERLNASAYGNDPINWRASPLSPSPGFENNGNRIPAVYAGPDQSIVSTSAPVSLSMTGSAVDDGQPNPPGKLTISWSQVSGPGQVWFSSPSQTNATAFFPGTGTYVLRLSADDGSIVVSDDVTIAIQHAAGSTPTTLVPQGSVWKYLDNGSDQGTAWIQAGFNDSLWASGPAPLGYGDANGQLPATTVSYGPDINNKYITTYFRQKFSIPSAAAPTNLVVNVQRDDGVMVYLNGTPIFTNNMPASPFTYLTPAPVAVGGTDETTFYPQAVDPSLLVNGVNVLAAEVHQSGGTSSDIIFDLFLTGDTFAVNAGPTVNAGTDQTVTLPAAASLSGTVHDDGLPVPPGLLNLAWSKISGPGTVTFANAAAPNTSASFGAAGTYVLRLTVNDSVAVGTDDVSITANSVAAPLQIQSVDTISGSSPTLRVRFVAQVGQTYTVQYSASLPGGPWLKVSDVPAQSVTQTVEVTDPISAGTPKRFYRIVSPQQP
jgi:hypothetical protein